MVGAEKQWAKQFVAGELGSRAEGRRDGFG